MRRLLVALGGAVAVAGAHAAPVHEHAAACVAALKAGAEPLVERVRRGDAAAQAQLLPLVTASFAFVGAAYKDGLRGPEADALLRRAEQAQAVATDAERARSQQACRAEGEELLAQASVLERQFVKRAARARLERLQRDS